MSKLYKSSEVATHNDRKSCWIVIKNNVYDVTSYLEDHPGGEEPLLDSAGMDATTAFEEVGHSAYAKKQLNKFKIGSLAPGEKCGKLKYALLALAIAIIAGVAYKKYAAS
ncbi:unnamed protein product [Arctia plantaginis]|uniref:Cytochrome b5 heme-binding domain-containing protein n=1 Tax=Arctia plantaginis TaxID=874455 RepID=A0A8S0Z5P3_ARCPL|nr:unnamed protein product [Arctia plantaginis]CAB3228259.1 unnamed protein product [Arctia plantaginis]